MISRPPSSPPLADLVNLTPTIPTMGGPNLAALVQILPKLPTALGWLNLLTLNDPR